jgi:hypothetical protein
MLVDRFLAERKPQSASSNSDTSGIVSDNSLSNSDQPVQQTHPIPETKPQIESPPAGNSDNGHKPLAADFVCEDDVKRAIVKGEKIYISAKTIITPSARELGEAREVFAKA